MNHADSQETFVVCPRCHGYGANHADAPNTHCHLCGGDGKVWEKDGYYRRKYQRKDTAVLW